MPAFWAGRAGPANGAINLGAALKLKRRAWRCYYRPPGECFRGMTVGLANPRGDDGASPPAFQDKTVLIAGAGCGVGRLLCRGYAGGGARVVAMDGSEPAVLALARQAPARVEALALDPWQPAACRRLGAAWQDEPLHVLVHLQPLCRPGRPAAAMAAIELLTVALIPGLGAGRGRVLILIEAATPDDSVSAGRLHTALRGLAAGLDARHRASGVSVNAVLVPPGKTANPDPAAIWQAAALLTAPAAMRAGGAVIPLRRGPD